MHWTTLRPFLTGVLLAGYHGQTGASTETHDEFPKCKCVSYMTSLPTELPSQEQLSRTSV